MLIQSVFKSSAIAALWLIATSAAIAQSLPEMRMTPAEIQASALDSNQIWEFWPSGSSHESRLRRSFQSGLLHNSAVRARSHYDPGALARDDRIATVVSGEWHLGYGNHFDARSLKTLPPGSVYSEPAGDHHFAQTSADPVIVEISGYGPTDTRYFEAKNDPKARENPR